MNIKMTTVPNDMIKLRHGFTGADWFWDGETLVVLIAAELTDWRERAALALHEISEALICRHMGVTTESIDLFDENFKGEHLYDVNAGDETKAPYRIPHMFATAIERIFCGVVGVDWKSYEERLCKL